MSRKVPNIVTESIAGSKYNNLQFAQSAALQPFINDLSTRRLLADGWLIQRNGTANIQQGINRLPSTTLTGSKTR